MLEELSVRNFALIDSLSLSFDRGFSVLTGETGAGKSIIVGSISFLLGARADAEVIRSGCDEAQVSAVVFAAPGSADALDWLKARDIETDEGRIIVRRSVKASGRGSIYIQNVPVTRGELAEFMGFLFDLHGQHAHESLLRKETHRKYLDRFAGLEDPAAEFNRVFLELAEKRKALEASLGSERDRDTRLEILNYGVEEIEKAAPKSGEIRELEAEAQRLSDFERLAAQVNTASSALFAGETSLLGLARRARAAMESAAAIDEGLAPLLKRMEDLYYEAEDLAGEFRNYEENLTYDPQRLETVEERLALLYKLKKKYPSPGASSGNPSLPGQTGDEWGILAWKEEALAEIEALSGAGENRDRLKAEIGRLERDLSSRAAALSAARAEGAKRLGREITGILSRLGMPRAAFSAAVLSKGAGREGGEKASLLCGPWGADDVEFMISANAGEPLKELARIASGGELSRVMLAVKTILSGGAAAGKDLSADTLVFDEIDTGIGGEVALAVGEYLSRIGGKKQIFCVTHLASIAVRADNHFKVEKKVIPGGAGDRTVTGLVRLEREERRREIARMLAGDAGAAALAHADELLEKYGRS
ncbi:MAG: DNA repair protein RecN [Treponema sp.]|jgi:DNA repair protein RecN (Recombination protein N)|nr:DNA repair protein RecN [Treponema sp.]